MNVGARRNRASSAVLSLLVALVAMGCEQLSREPLPGSFHLTSDPPLAPYPMIIRIDDIGGPSGSNWQFERGDAIVVDGSTLPLPQQIEVSGQDCEGTFEIQERIETDLLLILTGDACRIQLLGEHPRGEPHVQPDASGQP